MPSPRAVYSRSGADAPIRIIANRPDTGQPRGYARKLRDAQRVAPPAAGRRACCFSRCSRPTPRSSARSCTSRASTWAAIACCAASSPAIPNAIAALLLIIRDRTRQHPARIFRMDRRKSDRLSAEVPRVRRRRHGTGHAGSAQAGRTGSGVAASDPMSGDVRFWVLGARFWVPVPGSKFCGSDLRVTSGPKAAGEDLRLPDSPTVPYSRTLRLFQTPGLFPTLRLFATSSTL